VGCALGHRTVYIDLAAERPHRIAVEIKSFSGWPLDERRR
jgi:hypothetical protein